MTIMNTALKAVALAIAVFIAFAYWERRDNGRYSYHEVPATEHTDGSIVVLDTRTGIIFTVYKGGGIGEVDLKTGKITDRKPATP